MAKDDYYVIVYKILAYLYVKLKAWEDIDQYLIMPGGQFCKINERYWTYIMIHMLRGGYIEGISTTRTFGAECIVNNLDCIQITPRGIDYLCNNSLFEKAKAFLKDVKEITPS
ncbi:MAG: YjcQ family protein [Lachnospiraceae bacterium]|nr:YjcQ family protein [Lachnospiraceae bacterium]